MTNKQAMEELDKEAQDISVMAGVENAGRTYRRIVDLVSQVRTKERAKIIQQIKEHDFIIPQGHITRALRLDDSDLIFLDSLQGTQGKEGEK